MDEEKSWEGPVCKFNFGTFSLGSPRISWNYANESWPISRDSGQNWALNYYWSCNTTLLKGRLHASTFVVCWRKCLIEIKTFFQQKMLNKRHQTCMLHVLKLLIQQMFYNNVWTCSRGLWVSVVKIVLPNVTFGGSILRSAIGWKNSRPFFQPMRSKPKTNRDLLACVFPRLAPATFNLLWFLIGSLHCLSLLWLDSNYFVLVLKTTRG